jgi:DNA-binding XRE family transcriptional regulator
LAGTYQDEGQAHGYATPVPKPPDEKTKALLRAFGANLRAERSRRKLTQDEMAATLGIDPSYYAKFERGLVNITIGTLATLSELLGVPVTKLLKPSEPVEIKRGRPKKTS